jgi:hypothetical protein
MFSEAAYKGLGFGLGFAMVTDPARYGVIASPSEFSWGGMAFDRVLGRSGSRTCASSS